MVQTPLGEGQATPHERMQEENVADMLKKGCAFHQSTPLHSFHDLQTLTAVPELIISSSIRHLAVFPRTT